MSNGPQHNSLWERLGQQLRRPHGTVGRMLGHLMVRVNAKPNALALAALDLAQARSVVELACGPGAALQQILASSATVQVTGVDASPEMLTQAERRNRQAVRAGRLRLLQADFAKLPLPDATVDRVVGINAAYFFNDAMPVMEVHRILLSGGLFVLYVNTRASMARWRFISPASHRLYDEPELRTLLMDGGFSATDIEIHDLSVAPGIRGLVAVARRA